MDQRAQTKPFRSPGNQFNGEPRALAWRLSAAGPFDGIVCTNGRGGLVPAAMAWRVSLNCGCIETVVHCQAITDYQKQGQLQVIKGISPRRCAISATARARA